MLNYFSQNQTKEREKDISLLLGKEILVSESMQRLRGVSFLGVLNVVAGIPEEQQFTRYDHSISVAYLAWHYCQYLKLPKEISLTATLLALIHDISHPPFSHSTEIYLKIRSGVGTQHTSALTKSKITKVLKESYDSLPSLLQKNGLDGLATTLYSLFNRKEREKYNKNIGDMFDTPFCPDTFDGINRAWHALNTEEVKNRLGVHKFTYLEALDPMALVRFISSTTNRPLVYRSPHPPTESNLILRFHKLIRVLYNDVIYSHWQSSAMVMFARVLEIAYEDAEKFEFSQKEDKSVIKKIKKNATSNMLYNRIIKGKTFYPLSEKNPNLYKLVIDYLAKTKKQNKSYNYKDTKKTIETIVADKLGIDDKLIFCHVYRPLIWSSDNIWFKEIPINIQNKRENLWHLKWDPSEGEQDIKTKIEVYYTISPT
ncbi:MAG: HD domain-containing protein [Chloroflexi bacterium]|nr:HD domain-containing protein [Chloroflexota bacterium]MBI5963929.1 HD domain-containing protein [Chloroflexota bacterium]